MTSPTVETLVGKLAAAVERATGQSPREISVREVSFVPPGSACPWRGGAFAVLAAPSAWTDLERAGIKTLLDTAFGTETLAPGCLAVTLDLGDGPLPEFVIEVEPAKTTPPAFDLLLDLELPVTVSFGRTQISLKDVLGLASGSIVDLNRAVMEPVDLRVNDSVIARGEVVVVEGNYGVRISEIVSRQDRMKAL